jgi:magnesium-transporting ATPase (P-type)
MRGDPGVVLVNALIGSLQEGRAERSMAALRRLSALRVRVLRDGGERVRRRGARAGAGRHRAAGRRRRGGRRCPPDRPGAAAGGRGRAHRRVGAGVKSVAPVPEATGLADRHCMVYSGTHVTAGRARAVVVATGVHTEVGRIAGLTERAEEPKTPLELRLEQFGRALVVAALGLFVLVVLLGLWRELPLSEVLMVAISQMVSMVPEGLPVAMTIALAVGMQRMADRGAIIRRLSAVETLGSTTVICSDKTGTLTRNEMTAVALWLPGGARSPSAASATRPRAISPRRQARGPDRRPCAARAAAWPPRCATTPSCCRRRMHAPAGRCWATRPKARCWCWRARPASTSTGCAGRAARGRAALRQPTPS